MDFDYLIHAWVFMDGKMSSFYDVLTCPVQVFPEFLPQIEDKTSVIQPRLIPLPCLVWNITFHKKSNIWHN